MQRAAACDARAGRYVVCLLFNASMNLSMSLAQFERCKLCFGTQKHSTHYKFMSKLSYQICLRYLSLVIFLAMPIAASAFFGSDQKYDGNWVSQDKKETISIQKNDKSYLVVSSSDPGKKLVGKLGADGVLTVEVPLARLDFVFESKTGNLIGGGKTFTRAKLAPKMTEDELRRWVSSFRAPTNTAVFGAVGVSTYSAKTSQEITWQPAKNRWMVAPSYLERLKKWQAAGFATITEIPLGRNMEDFGYSSIHEITPTAKFWELYKGKLIDSSGKQISDKPAAGQLAWVPFMTSKYVVFDTVSRTSDDGVQSVLILTSQEKSTNALYSAVSQTPFTPGLIAVVQKLDWDVRLEEWVRKVSKQLVAGTKEEMKQQELYRSMFQGGNF